MSTSKAASLRIPQGLNHCLTAWIESWALSLGITSPRRARQQASGARQWGLGLIVCCHIILMEAYASESVPSNVASAAITRFDAQEQGWQWYQAPEEDEESEEPVVAEQPKVTQPPLSCRSRDLI